MRMRVTAHNGRAGKAGAYSPLHNDRNFDQGKAEHISVDKASGNRYWHWLQADYPKMSFDDAERQFYARFFYDGLQARNDRYLAQRHPERVQDIDGYRSNPRSCPEEVIMQVGNKSQTIDPAELWKICVEHINWERKTFPAVKILDVALHTDEEGAPHMQVRKVWVGHDKDGYAIVGQSKALAEMGIQPPEPGKKYGKYNNAKMTYTQICRDHLIDVCRAYGLEIETQPKEASKSGLSLMDYKANQAREQAQREQAVAHSAERRAQQAERKAQAAELRFQEALRGRDAARADQDVQTVLQEAVGNVLTASPIEVDILADKPAKRSFGGRETPATVTIKREDFERLQGQANVNVRIYQAAKSIGPAVADMQDAAAVVRQNAIDAHETAVDNRVRSAERERDALAIEMDAIAAERDELRNRLDKIQRVIDHSPATWDGMERRMAEDTLRTVRAAMGHRERGRSAPKPERDAWGPSL